MVAERLPAQLVAVSKPAEIERRAVGHADFRAFAFDNISDQRHVHVRRPCSNHDRAAMLCCRREQCLIIIATRHEFGQSARTEFGNVRMSGRRKRNGFAMHANANARRPGDIGCIRRQAIGNVGRG